MRSEKQPSGHGYFGGNYRRLQEIKTKYDPHGRFDKEFTVERL